MKRSLLLAAILALGAPSFAADLPPANRFAVAAAPAEKFEAGGLLVERHGDHGTPMILIPGLASGAWVWQETVRQFQGEHVLYVVTLPGFDGRPATGGDVIAKAQQGLAELISSRKLAKPVLVGHSLGATLALAFAEKHPDSVGGVVAIDGLPVFPGTENVPLAQRAQMAAAMKARMAGMTRDAFVAQQAQYMRVVGSIDMSKADDLARMTSRSDPAAVADYMEGALALDLRHDLPAITAPVLVIAPYFEADSQTISAAAKADYYRTLMNGTPKLNVVPVSPARHFAMIDQPQQVNDAIRAYLKSL
ncbi:MAG TPA: alpha/beta hydrolase [Telluria sp.]|nr:alpha/beta hydrolase [Telluria sp.]